MFATAYNSQSILPPGWCPEADTRDHVLARRNVLTALWAGRLMQLSEPALAAYAAEVHAADFEKAGDEDVVAKLAADLRQAGASRQPSEIRSRLAGFHREALRQTAATD